MDFYAGYPREANYGKGDWPLIIAAYAEPGEQSQAGYVVDVLTANYGSKPASADDKNWIVRRAADGVTYDEVLATFGSVASVEDLSKSTPEIRQQIMKRFLGETVTKPAIAMQQPPEIIAPLPIQDTPPTPII